MHPSGIDNETRPEKPRVHGIRTGLAVVRESVGPTSFAAFATLRAVTWGGDGMMNVSAIELTRDDVATLRDSLNDILGDF